MFAGIKPIYDIQENNNQKQLFLKQISEAGQGCFGRWRRLLRDHLNCLQGEEEEIEVTPGNTIVSRAKTLTDVRPSFITRKM